MKITRVHPGTVRAASGGRKTLQRQAILESARISLRATSASLRIGAVFGVLLATMASAVLAGPADEAQQIASLAGFHGGLVIHVGCGDGKLTAALHLADNCVVQGLETDAKTCRTARAAIRALGLYGPVSVLHWSGKETPLR